jgi:hypothetical protein
MPDLPLLLPPAASGIGNRCSVTKKKSTDPKTRGINRRKLGKFAPSRIFTGGGA